MEGEDRDQGGRAVHKGGGGIWDGIRRRGGREMGRREDSVGRKKREVKKGEEWKE